MSPKNCLARLVRPHAKDGSVYSLKRHSVLSCIAEHPCTGGCSWSASQLVLMTLSVGLLQCGTGVFVMTTAYLAGRFLSCVVLNGTDCPAALARRHM